MGPESPTLGGVNRRVHERHRLWFPVWIHPDGDDPTLPGVSHDASVAGIRVATGGAPEVGAHVVVTFRFPPEDGVERSVTGTVVRIEENADDPDGLWPKRVAVEFDEPMNELAALLEAASTRFAEISSD